MSAVQPGARRPWALLDVLLVLVVVVGLALVLLGAALRLAYHHQAATELAPSSTVLLLPVQAPGFGAYSCIDGSIDKACVDLLAAPYTAVPSTVPASS